MSTRPFQAIYSSSDVRETADRLGSYFFSADTMRAFHSRLSDFHLPATIGTPNPYGDPEGEQVGYIVTSDRTTFGDDAPRGWKARRYTVTRRVTHDYIASTTPSPSAPWCDVCGGNPEGHESAGTVKDRIAFESINADDEDGPDKGLNGWHATKVRAILAAQLDYAARVDAHKAAQA